MSTVRATSRQVSVSNRRAPLQVTAGLRFFSKFNFEQKRAEVRPVTQQTTRKRWSSPGPARSSSVLDRAAAAPYERSSTSRPALKYHGLHHVGLLCKNLEKSLEFYQGILGLEINPDRPDHKLPYRGAWLWIGAEMIHLMELDNPDPMTGRPEHGGRDRHFCIGVADIKPLVERLKAADVTFTMSMSGRPAVFFRDPDMNCLEVVEQEPWR